MTLLNRFVISYDGNKPVFNAENDEGYIEYKLRLDHTEKMRLNKMITQMKFRLNEGKYFTSKYIT